MNSRTIRMKIRSVRYDVEASFFSSLSEEPDFSGFLAEDEKLSFDNEERIEINTEGKCTEEGTRVDFSYEESEITGMEGSSTTVSFDQREPGLVSMLRTGSVSTALVFEAGKRHHCVYQTPIMPFEICVHTLQVKNRLLDEGYLHLDYIIEIRGAMAERTRFEMTVL